MNKKNLFHYNSKILKVSELAAIAVYDFIGKKDENAADKAAVEAMRTELNKLDFSGTIVIGEGERDKAPMLYIGEKVGNGKSGLNFDIALDPLEGTKITANNEKNALTVISLGNKGSFLNAPDVYMEKIAVGKGLPKNFLDLDIPLEETLNNLAFYKKKKINDLVVCFLDSPRHSKISNIVDKYKCKKFLIPDGDIFGAIGGAPEGVLAAAALKCLGGQMQGRLIFNDNKQKTRAKSMGIKDLKKKYNIKDLIKKDSLFSATGVTNGYLLNGIKKKGNIFITHSLIISTKNKKIEFKKSEFRI